MNIALVIGKENSVGVPGKNLKEIVGRPAVEYAFIAAKYSGADHIFVSTDSVRIAEIGQKYGARWIQRPAELATPDALTEDALTHAFNEIERELEGIKVDATISLLFANNPAIDVNLLKEAIEFLNNDEEFDSCFSVAKYDMFSPARARSIGDDGEILPAVDLNLLGDVSSIRDSHGSTYFCDLSVQVMRPCCFTNMESGALPFKWQGKRSKAVITDFGFDIDADWQAKVIEFWLQRRGYTETTVPWVLEQ